MPSPNATRFELAVYVEPEHVERFRKLLNTPKESESIPLHIEKVIGAMLAGEPMSDRDYGFAEHGVDVAEVNPEGES